MRPVRPGAWERWAPLGGIGFAVLMVVAARLPGSPPKIDDPARAVVAFVADERLELRVAAVVGGIATLGLLWWAGALWRQLAPGENGGLAVVALVGLGIGVTALDVALGVQAAVALRLEDLGPHAARFVFGLSRLVFDAGAFGFAALVGAASLAARRAGTFPRLLSDAGLGLTLGWVVASYGLVDHGFVVDSLGPAVFVAWLVWVLAMSVVMLRAARASDRD